MSDAIGEFLSELATSIEPVSEVDALRARERLRRLDSATSARLGPLAERLCAARRALAVPIRSRSVVICAADHGNASRSENAASAIRETAGGSGALAAAARGAEASLVLVDCGLAGGERDLGRGVLSFRIGDGTADSRVGPAMPLAHAGDALRTGVALVYSLADAGLDVVATGALGAGSEEGGERLIGRLVSGGPPLDALAAVGGYETGVLAGAMLAAASIHVPVVLDGVATAAAALLAARLCDRVPGYLFASHAGSRSAHRVALDALGIAPVLELGLARGEGTGAALVLPVIDAAARIVAEIG